MTMILVRDRLATCFNSWNLGCYHTLCHLCMYVCCSGTYRTMTFSCARWAGEW